MIDVLSSLSVFRGLQEPDLHWLASKVDQIALPAGAVLFSQGDPGDAIYIVCSGTLQVVLTLPDGEAQILAVIEPGKVVGEMAVLYQRPRSTTVTAVTAAELLKIRVSTLDRLFTGNPCLHTQFTEVASRRLPSLYLASVPIFAGLDTAVLRNLDLESNWIRLAGGQTLFKQGDPPDYLYVVVHGRLEVIVEREAGQQEIVDRLGQGDCVGEVAIFTGVPRNATVRAIRDCELVRLSKTTFHGLLEGHPRCAFEIMRILAARIRPALPAHHNARVSTIAVVPLNLEGLPHEWINRLVETLSRIGGPSLHVSRKRIEAALGGETATALSDDLSRVRVTSWLREQEDQFRYVVSECDPTPSAWTDLCLRQADLVLMVAAAKDCPPAGELGRCLSAAENETRSAPKELVLLHPEGTAHPSGTARWLTVYPVARHHHLRIERAEDYSRLARFIAGKAVGLAMSGGGARGYAHIGVIRALKESGIPIDGVSGVSAGSFTAAFCMMGLDSDESAAASLDYIWKNSFTRDPTLPIVALLSGKNYVRVLRHVFGEVDIEDLWLPGFCVSTNLSTSRVFIHDRGPLWRAIRATTSLPGAEPPVCIDGDLFVDGGVLNNLPADIMRSRGFGKIIASDVSRAADLKTDREELVSLSGWRLLWRLLNPFSSNKPSIPNIFEILSCTATVGSSEHGAAVPLHSDLYLRPPGQEVSTFDWKSGRTLLERARHYALEEIAKAKIAEGFPP